MSAVLTPVLRRVPLGMLMIAALVALGGLGILTGGGYLIVRGDGLSTWTGATAILVGPAILYFVYHLVRCAPWTWLTLVTVTALLFVSSVLRLVLSSGSPGAAVIEILLEAMVMTYLQRSTVRAAYGWNRARASPAP